jgi:hypothetical protein
VPAYRFCPRKDDYTAAILDGARRISKNASPMLEEYPSYEVEGAQD